MSGSFVSRRTVRTSFLHGHSAKIKLCDLHPTKPWLATADENGRVQVWNYAANSVVIDFDVSSFSQMSLVDSFLEGFVDDKRALDAKPEKCGDVKKILFFDYDVIGVSVPLVARQKIFPTVPVAERFLVIICEQRVLVWSLESHAVVDLSTQDPVFEGKNISSGCLIPSKNRIMIGLSDGSLRRADLPHLGNLARPSAPSPHGKHISGMMCIENWESYSPTAPMQPTVVSVAADGTMCGWNSEFLSLEFEKSKVHSGMILGVQYLPSLGQIVTFGTDKTIALWDAEGDHHELYRLRVPLSKKGQLVSVWSRMSASGLSTEEIMVAEKISGLFSVSSDLDKKGYEQVFDLEDEFEKSLTLGKKAVKIYCVRGHPVHSDIVACTTNVGVVVLSIDPTKLPPVDVERTETGFRAYLLIDAAVRVADIGHDGSYKLKEDPRISLPRASRAMEVSLSPSGAYLSVTSQDKGWFCILTTKRLDRIFEGDGNQVMWDVQRDVFWLLQVRQNPIDPKLTPKKKSARRKTLQLMAKAQTTSSVLIYTVSGDQVRPLHESRPQLTIPDVVSNMFRGPVALLSLSKGDCAMYTFDGEYINHVPLMPPEKVISSGKFFAACHSNECNIFVFDKEAKALTRVHAIMSPVRDGFFMCGDAFVYSTDLEVRVVFLDSDCRCALSDVLLARVGYFYGLHSLAAGPSPISVHLPHKSVLPPAVERSIGSVKLVGASRKGEILGITSGYEVFHIPLDLMVCLRHLVACGKEEMVKEWEPFVQPQVMREVRKEMEGPKDRVKKLKDVASKGVFSELQSLVGDKLTS